MNDNSPNTIYFKNSMIRTIALVAMMLMGVSSVMAQDYNTLKSQVGKALKKRDYQTSRALSSLMAKEFEKRAAMLYGPSFGEVYYYKGYSEAKLADAAKREGRKKDSEDLARLAINSFKTCYEKYPTGKDVNRPNKKRFQALQGWAKCCMDIGEYKEAIRLYKRFLKERGKHDRFKPSPGGFNVNLAICHFRLKKPDIKTGMKYFEVALKNKDRLKTRKSSVVAGFLALSTAVIAEKKEKLMVDFINNNRDNITLEPYEMAEFAPVFIKLAADALEADLYLASFSLYSLTPDTDVMIQDLEARITSLAGRPGIRDGKKIIYLNRLTASLKQLKKLKKEGKTYDIQALGAMAFLQDKMRNQMGVYAALLQLELYYKKAKNREDNLFNLARVSALLNRLEDTEKYGNLFLKTYPKSSRISAVQNMMLASLFFSKEYKKALYIAQKMLPTLKEGTDQHDMCLFVLGGSHYYLGHYAKAQPLFEKHVKLYPKSKFIMNTEYFRASNLTRFHEWDKAAKLLDAFIKKYPSPKKNYYLAIALYDRANCSFSKGELPDALVYLNRIEAELSKSSVVGMAYNMKGNILESDSKLKEAESYYRKALAVAEKRNNRSVAAEALNNLVGMLGAEKIDKKRNPRIKEAVPFYDKFMKSYSDSYFKPQVAVYGLGAMKAAGRLKEGLLNLQKVIAELSSKKNPHFIDECIIAYSKYFFDVKGNTPDKLKDIFYDFPGINPLNKRMIAMLRIAIIRVYGEQIQKAKEDKKENLVAKYESAIKILFQDLEQDFNPKELTASVLLEIADYLRTKTKSPKKSLVYYEEILKRKDAEDQKLKARLGVADVMGNSKSKSDNKKALVQLGEIYKLAKGDKKVQEKALFRQVEIADKIGEWKTSQSKAREYLNAKYQKHASLVSYYFARSFDKSGENDNAIFYYSMVYARYPGYLRISAPSVLRVMQLLWDRNLPKGAEVGSGEKKITLKVGDRQNAYSGIGSYYIKTTKKIRETNEKVTDEEKEVWDEVAALVKTYENSGEVKTLKELKEERRKRRRGGK